MYIYITILNFVSDKDDPSDLQNTIHFDRMDAMFGSGRISNDT